jgi:hypothetical protein
MSRPVIVSKVIEATAGTIVDPSGELRKYGVQGADIASAAAINLPVASGDYVRVTGTTNISSLGDGVAGLVRTVEFTGILSLIYNSSNLILPGAVNMVTAPNDVSIFRCRGGNSWICISYQTAAGAPPVSLTPGDVGLGNVENIKLSTWPGSANLTTLGTVTGGVWQATPIAPNKGGTGLTGVAQGDMLYSDTANSIRRLPKNTTQSRYLSNQGGLNNDPDWQLVNLANGVTGILPGANGGRGALVQTVTAPTGITVTIDMALGNLVYMNMASATGNVTLTINNAVPGLLNFLCVIQGATIRALIWPAGSVQTLLGGATWNPSGASKTDVITFVYDGGKLIILGTAPDIG